MVLASTSELLGHKLYRDRLDRDSDESAANTAITVSTVVGTVRRISSVEVLYSASVSQTVVVTRNSGAGAAYDVRLQNIVIAADVDGVWTPDGPIFLLDDDVLDVLAPAGGVGITAAVAIYTEILS